MCSTLWDMDLEELKRILLCGNHGSDILVWHFHPSGEFTVKTGYHLAQYIDEEGSNGLLCGLAKVLKKVWNSRIPPRIKIHIWRLLFDALPTRVNLFIRRIIHNQLCSLCQNHNGDIPHLFWYCSFAQKVWKSSGLWFLLSDFKRGDVGDLFQWIFDNGSSEEFVMICWSIWIARNDQMFQGKKQSGIDVLNGARRVRELYFFSSIPLVHAEFLNPRFLGRNLLQGL